MGLDWAFGSGTEKETDGVMNEYAIETFALTQYYGRRRGIQDVWVLVPAGTIYGFLGPNGAGKTTTIRALLGFLRPTSGTARVAGYDIRRETLNVRRHTGYLPGEVRLFNRLTGYGTLKYFAQLRGTNCRTRAEELARLLDLDLNVKVRYYSRGMRQKLGLIQAMMHRPAVLILDEPTNSLDPLIQQVVYDLLRDYTAEGGTVFFSSHIISEVERICDRVGIIREGKLVADDAIEQLRQKSMQHVRLVLKTGSRLPDPLPEGMRLMRSDGGQIHLLVEGPAELLRRLLVNLELEYLTIEPPSLEEVFLRFYRDANANDPE